MNNYGRFGALLGTIYIGHTHCKYLVYAARNAEVLTCHEVQLKEINTQIDWVEFDPVEIYQNVIECIQGAIQNLIILDINPDDIIAVAVTNQRETTILWNKITGKPLYNAIAWNDCRTSSLINTILAKNHNRINCLKSICGLPFSNCFSAIKCKWLIDNVPSIKSAVRNHQCLFGTLDTWILWNLTGGINDGVHITDVTNASRTMLMNLETLEWDSYLCTFFQIPKFILPKIKSCAEIYGYVYDGPLKGIPIAACLGEHSGSLLGQMCLYAHQATCTYEGGCNLLINTGQEIIDSENGLLTTLAFQLGPKQKPTYALEGAIAYAGSAISWLKENLSLKDEPISNNATTFSNGNNGGGGGINTIQVQTFLGDSAVLSSYSSGSNFNALSAIDTKQTNVVFVPAFSGLYSPFWKHNASGLMLGLNHQTSAYQVILAAYEAICFQTRDLLEAFVKDVPTWNKFDKLTVGGEFSENPFLLQLLADLCGIKIERPQTAFPSCLGAMLAAGMTMNILNLEQSAITFAPPIEIFRPTMCATTKDGKYRNWKFAIRKCINWNGIPSDNNFKDIVYEDRDPDIILRCSIPGTIYIVTSVALVIITKFYQNAK